MVTILLILQLSVARMDTPPREAVSEGVRVRARATQ